MLRRILVFIVLLAFWWILSGDKNHLPLGIVSCLIVTALSGDLLFVGPQKSIGQLVGEGFRFIAFIPWLLWEIVIANFHVLRLALAPNGCKEVRPRIIRYTTKLKGDFPRFMLANCITLTPGTITVEMIGDDLFIHAISDVTAKGLEGPMEKKIGHIFGEKV